MENQSFRSVLWDTYVYIQNIGSVLFSSRTRNILHIQHIHQHHLITLRVFTQYWQSNLHGILSADFRLIANWGSLFSSMLFSLFLSYLQTLFFADSLPSHSFSSFRSSSIPYFAQPPLPSTYNPFDEMHSTGTANCFTIKENSAFYFVLFLALFRWWKFARSFFLTLSIWYRGDLALFSLAHHRKGE